PPPLRMLASDRAERLHRRRLLGALLAPAHTAPAAPSPHADLRDETLLVVRTALLDEAIGGALAEEPLRDLLQLGLVVVQPGRGVLARVGREVSGDDRAGHLVAGVEVDGAQERLVGRGQDGALLAAAALLLALA